THHLSPISHNECINKPTSTSLSSNQSPTLTMPSLMSLPRELRDQIIDLALTPVQPPTIRTLNASTGTIEEAPTRKPDDDKISSSDSIFRPPEEHTQPARNAYRPQALGLLCANSQLNAEVLERAERQPQTCIVDWVVLDAVYEVRTWIAIPISTRSALDCVEINIRCYGWSNIDVDDAVTRAVYSLLEYAGNLLTFGCTGAGDPYCDDSIQQYWYPRMPACSKRLRISIDTQASPAADLPFLRKVASFFKYRL
ncbi:hypothetical protein BDV95DRAFT_578610, partial [Massariosphaeria phaeospora]